ncbi:MAG: sulfur carrier protein ThiS [Acidimicrobiales bacterium]
MEVPDGATVASLLDKMGLSGRWVLVEHNGTAVPRAEQTSTRLADGDRLELVRAVAGG